ncbi:hypothetical protein FRC10_008075, partial [Ceratobasidium sp. 414]
ESVRLEDITVSSLFYSTTVPTLGPYQQAPYLSLLSGGLEPSRPSSAVAPIRGLANRLSTSATPSSPLPTVPAAPLGDGLTLPAPHPTATPLPDEASGSGQVFLSLPPADSDGKFLVAGPWVATDDQTILDSPASEAVWVSSFLARKSYTVATPEPAGATSTPAPVAYLILSPAAGTPDGCPSWASQHALVLVWTLPLPVYLGIVIGLYLARPKDAGTPDIRKVLRVLEELGDLPRIISEYDISPGELRDYIELAVRTRESEYGNPTAEPEISNVQGKYCILFKRSSAPCLAPAQVDLTASPSTAGMFIFAPPFLGLILTATTPGTPDVANPSDGLATEPEDGLAASRLARLSAEMREHDERFDWALEDLFEGLRNLPRRADMSMEDDAPVAGPSVERRGTEMRGRENVSPLAHRGAGGLELGGMMPTPESFRPRAELGARRARGNAADAAITFDPVATSSPVRARQPTSYASIMALAGTYPSRPSAPEPDRTLEISPGEY